MTTSREPHSLPGTRKRDRAEDGDTNHLRSRAAKRTKIVHESIPSVSTGGRKRSNRFPAASSAQGTQSIPAFTFGLEMEIVVQVDPLPYASQLPTRLIQSYACAGVARKAWSAALSLPEGVPGSHEHLIRADMAATLHKAGFAVNDIRAQKDAIKGCRRQDVLLEDTDKWSVATDATIDTSLERARRRGNKAVIGVELKTRCLPFSDMALEEVGMIVALLKQRYIVGTNSSCQLHVHVGLVDEETGEQVPFELEWCQNLAVLSLASESQMQKLCSVQLLQDMYCRPLSERFGGRVECAIESVEGTKSLLEFLNTIGKGRNDRRYAINFQNLREEARFGTVEFRQHEGSFDTEQIAMRVRLCVGLVNWALESQGLPHILRTRCSSRRPDVLRLLRVLKVERRVIEFYAERIFGHLDS